MENLIEVRDLRKNFGPLTAVDGVSMTIRRGEVLGFLGPNGAGKSTTMKMITGFLAPTGGSVAVCGHDVATAPLAAKQCIGYLPEGAPAYGEMTPAAFLEFIADIRGLAGPAREARIREVVEQINLGSVLHQSIETLSKGFKRRVGLAQAILHDPQVLILDEPTDGLDPNQKHEVRSLIQQMAPTKAIVISTHILEEVDAVCTRAAIIARGKLLFTGTPAELEARSAWHNAVTVAVAPTAVEATRDALAALPAVAGVVAGATLATSSRLTALARDGQRIFETVQEALRSRGVDATEVFVESGHLDEVFRSITTGGHTAAEAQHS